MPTEASGGDIPTDAACWTARPARDAPPCPARTIPVRPMLTRFRTAVVTLASITVRNLPITISARVAGLISRVSIVPRSFSPAHRSTAG